MNIRSCSAPWSPAQPGFMLQPLYFAATLLVLALFLGIGPTPAHAATKAGKVIMAKGTVEAVSGDTRRSLKRRSAVHTGEVVITGKDSRAQIRFIDGALLTLEPGSELSIEEYNYQDETGAPDQVLMRLVKGGLRTVTGAIGKSNQKAYRLDTPLATIGIRGTMFAVTLDRATGALEVIVDEGRVEVLNQFGSLLIGAGQPYRIAHIHGAIAPQGAEIPADPQPGSPPDSFEAPPDFVSSEPEQNPEYRNQLKSLEQDRPPSEVNPDGTASAPPQEIPPP